MQVELATYIYLKVVRKKNPEIGHRRMELYALCITITRAGSVALFLWYHLELEAQATLACIVKSHE
jgi:hypothetical protein